MQTTINEIDIKHGLADSNERRCIPRNQDPTVPSLFRTVTHRATHSSLITTPIKIVSDGGRSVMVREFRSAFSLTYFITLPRNAVPA